MKKMKRWNFNYIAMVILLLAGCESFEEKQQETQLPIRFMAEYPGMSRVTASAFEQEDRIGVFMNVEGEPLEASGNSLNNELLEFDGSAWNAERDLFWDAGRFDVYAYYPYDDDMRVVDDYPFSVSLNQNAVEEGMGMDGYEASDFLWANTRGVEASMEPVRLSFRHRMSKLIVRLVPGEDYEGDIPDDARVLVHNTVPDATIDLSVGLVTKDNYAATKTIEAKRVDRGYYTAIVVPQRLMNQVPLVEIVVQGVSYMVERKFVFKPGIQHTMTVTLAKNPEQIKIEIGGEIENWD